MKNNVTSSAFTFFPALPAGNIGAKTKIALISDFSECFCDAAGNLSI
jgi:hypothetical protein